METKKCKSDHHFCSVTIGEFRLTQVPNGQIILEVEGEGGVFDEARLADAIRKFYVWEF